MMKKNNSAEEEQLALTETAIKILFQFDLSENQIKKLINNECLQFLESLLQALKPVDRVKTEIITVAGRSFTVANRGISRGSKRHRHRSVGRRLALTFCALGLSHVSESDASEPTKENVPHASPPEDCRENDECEDGNGMALDEPCKT
ncbi:hypothetical protein S83_039551 [Arachis hypogaea]